MEKKKREENKGSEESEVSNNIYVRLNGFSHRDTEDKLHTFGRDDS